MYFLFSYQTGITTDYCKNLRCFLTIFYFRDWDNFIAMENTKSNSDLKIQQIYHPGKQLCIQVFKEDDGSGRIKFVKCDDSNPDQKWTWSKINEKPLARASQSKNTPGEEPPELDYIS